MKMKNTWCEDCGNVHWIQILQRDGQGRITKTKCFGLEFRPLVGNAKLDEAMNTLNYFVKRLGYGEYQAILKTKPERTRLPKIAKVEAVQKPVIMETPKRKCLAEISLFLQEKYWTLKVFEDATPGRFYEIFNQVSDTPTAVRPRELGKGKPVHLTDIPALYHVQGDVKITYHNRAEYERLLQIDPSSVSVISENNRLVAAGMGKS